MRRIERIFSRSGFQVFHLPYRIAVQGDPDRRWSIHASQVEDGWWDVTALSPSQSAGYVIGGYEQFREAVAAAKQAATEREHFEVTARLPWRIIQGGAA